MVERRRTAISMQPGLPCGVLLPRGHVQLHTEPLWQPCELLSLWVWNSPIVGSGKLHAGWIVGCYSNIPDAVSSSVGVRYVHMRGLCAVMVACVCALREVRDFYVCCWCSGPDGLSSYCPGDGIKYTCPGGVFGDVSGLTTSACSGPCAAGYFCPSGSTNATAVRCGGTDRLVRDFFLVVWCLAG